MFLRMDVRSIVLKIEEAGARRKCSKIHRIAENCIASLCMYLIKKCNDLGYISSHAIQEKTYE